jgi:hypothetical protein
MILTSPKEWRDPRRPERERSRPAPPVLASGFGRLRSQPGGLFGRRRRLRYLCTDLEPGNRSSQLRLGHSERLTRLDGDDS